jgi:hypothetical protein
MAGLPADVKTITVSELRDNVDKVLAALERGEAYFVESDDRQRVLGVLTRDERVFDEAHAVALADAGLLPADIEQLVDEHRTPEGHYSVHPCRDPHSGEADASAGWSPGGPTELDS